MRLNDPAPAEYAFGYRTPPASGNTVNGLGSDKATRARQVFHGSGSQPIEWTALENFFRLTMPWPLIWQGLRNRWQLRLADGPTAAERQDFDSPAAAAKAVKRQALQVGAGIIGITALTEDAIYEGYTPPHRTAIVIGVAMDRRRMETVPGLPAALEVLNIYRRVSRVAIDVAAHIRSLGWPARAYGESKCSGILHLPLAQAAGLGQLGKHGSLISRAHGSNFRIATVLTDMPLAQDKPQDIGVDDLCLSCRRCVMDCPPDAIFDRKQLVRGVTKWYVDFDKCVPYFVKTYGCAICIEVCPWSEPGRGPALSKKLLAKRRSRRRDGPNRNGPDNDG